MMPMMGMPPEPTMPAPAEGGMDPLIMLILQMLMGGGEGGMAPPGMAPPQIAMPPQDPAANPDLALAAGRRIGM
jgi:hypothetical protein